MEFVMKKNLIILFSLFFVFNYNFSISQRHPSELKFEPLRFDIPDIQRIQLKNGIVLYLLEDHELPLIEGSALIKTGSIYEQSEKTGLASLTGTVMRTGGTKSKSGDQIDEELEFIAGSIETGIGSESGSASISVLREDIDKGLELFADILMNPTFSEDKIDLAKKQVLEQIRRRNDEPNSILRREFGFLVYGKNSVFARVPYEETINDITREDIVNFHKKYFHPNNVIMGFTGDFDSNELIKKLGIVFKDWKKENINFPVVPIVNENVKSSINYVFKDINQSNIAIGHLGIKRHNPDYFSIIIMNEILNFQRLFFKIRTEEGLAYSVGSSFSIPSYEGTFRAVIQTKLESTVKAIELLKKLINEIRENPVTDEELDVAKNTYLNSFVFNFESSKGILSQRMNLEYNGYQKDYLKNFRDNIAKVTKENVQKVAQKYLHPDKFVILVVGNEEGFDKPLSTLGKVNTIKLEE
jgi:predicted Zn-dependent peptidase